MKRTLGAMMGAGMALCMLVPAAQANTDIAALVARMEAIIAQMQELQAEFAELSSEVAATPSTAAPSGAVLGAATNLLQQEAVYGETNDTITKIQILLATDPLIYPAGTVSGFFGPKTEAAIKNLQSRFGMDPVGVVGPATSALLMEYFSAYPDGEYPAGVLSSRPSVVATAPTPAPAVAGANTTERPTVANNRLSALDIRERDDEYYITVRFTDGSSKLVIASDNDEDTLVNTILKRTDLTRNEVLAVLDTDDIDTSSSRSSSSSDADEDEAEDAIDEADDAIKDAEDEIDEADDDGEETEYSEDLLEQAEELLEEAEEAFDDGDYDDALELAKEAEEKAGDAEDAIGEERSDAIRDIIAKVSGDRARIEVEYDDGEVKRFTVSENDEDDIIEAVADELDISERDVEDEIEFETADMDKIEVEVGNGVSFAKVFFEDGSTDSYTVFEDDEEDLIEKLAERLDVDEDDIEDIISFD